MSNTERAAFEVFKDMAESDGRPHEMTNPQVKRVRAQLDSSLFWFAQMVLGFQDLDANLHSELAAYIELLGTPGNDRLMTQIPRGHLKSSLGTVAHALWRYTRSVSLTGRGECVVIFNANEDNVSGWIRTIRTVLERSELYHTVYGDLLPRGVRFDDTRSRPQSLRWTDSALDLEGRDLYEVEASISGYGMGSAAEGHHWQWMILDDLIGKRERDSQADMQRAKNWCLTHTALMRPAESGNSYVNCTPWTYDDVYALMCKSYGYKLYRRAALEKPGSREASLQGEPIFPRFFTRDKLLRLYKANPVSFSSQYMCNPLPGETQSFDPDWVRWFSLTDQGFDEPSVIVIEPNSYLPRESQTAGLIAPRLIKTTQLNVRGFLDPAPAEGPELKAEPNARNGLCVEGIDGWARKFILCGKGMLERPIDVIHEMFRLARVLGFSTWYVEEVNFSVLYRHWIRQLQEPGQIYAEQYMQILPVKPERVAKEKRILNKVSGWQNGDYYLNRVDCDDFYKEFVEFPYGATRDILDAHAYDGKLTRPLLDEEEAMLMSAVAKKLADGMDEVTGY